MVFPSDSMAAADNFRKEAVAGEPTLVYRSKKRWGRTDSTADGSQEQGQKQLPERKGKQLALEKEDRKAIQLKEETMEDRAPEEPTKAEVKPKYKHSRKQSHARPAASDRLVETRAERRPEPKVEPKVEVKEDPPSDTESEEEVQKTRRKRRKQLQLQQQKSWKDARLKSEEVSEEGRATQEPGDDENHDDDGDDAKMCKRSDGKSWRCRRPFYKDGWCEYHFEYYEAKRLKLPLPSPPKRQKKTKVQRGKRSRDVTDFASKADRVEGKKRVMAAAAAAAASEQEGTVRRAEKRKTTSEGVAVRGTRSSPSERSAKRLKVQKDSGVEKVEDSDEKMSSRSRSSDSEGPEPAVDGKAGAGTSKRKVCHPNRCHQCWRLGNVIACKTCMKDPVHRRYCISCIEKWYPNLKKSDVEEKCPHCRGFCNCKTCLRKARPLAEGEQSGKVEHLQYLLRKLLPSLIHLYEEQREELDLERELQGDPSYEVETTRLSAQERMYCNRCKTSIVDYYRTCTACDYDLCLRCCREMRQQRREKDEAVEKNGSSTLLLDILPTDASILTCTKKSMLDGGCPSTPFRLPQGPADGVLANGNPIPVLGCQTSKEAAEEGDAGPLKTLEERDVRTAGFVEKGVAAPPVKEEYTGRSTPTEEAGDLLPVPVEVRYASRSESEVIKERNSAPLLALDEGDACPSAVTEEGEAGPPVKGYVRCTNGSSGAEGDENVDPAAADNKKEDTGSAALVDEDMADSAAIVKEEHAGLAAATEEINDFSATVVKAEKDTGSAAASEEVNDVIAAAVEEEKDARLAADTEEANDACAAALMKGQKAGSPAPMEEDKSGCAVSVKEEDAGTAAATGIENDVTAPVVEEAKDPGSRAAMEEDNTGSTVVGKGEEEAIAASAPDVADLVSAPVDDYDAFYLAPLEDAMEDDGRPAIASETIGLGLIPGAEAKLDDARVSVKETGTGAQPSERVGPAPLAQDGAIFRAAKEDGLVDLVVLVQNEEPGFSSNIDKGMSGALMDKDAGLQLKELGRSSLPAVSPGVFKGVGTGALPLEVQGRDLSEELAAVPSGESGDGYADAVASVKNEELALSSCMDERMSGASVNKDVGLLTKEEDARSLLPVKSEALKVGTCSAVVSAEKKVAPAAALQAGTSIISLESDMSEPVEMQNTQYNAQNQNCAMDGAFSTTSKGESAAVLLEGKSELDVGTSTATEGEDSGASALEEDTAPDLTAAQEGVKASGEGNVDPCAGEGGEGEVSNMDETLEEVGLLYASPWEATAEGAVPCAPKDWGGCGSGNLCLRSLQGPITLKQVVTDVERILSSTAQNDEGDSSVCTFCLSTNTSAGSHLLLAAHRDAEGDNYLYCPNVHELENDESLLHFQQHWSKGQPVIVKNVIDLGTGLSWEPMVMWRAVREKSKKKQQDDTLTVKAIECLSGCEVEIDIKKFFQDYERRRALSNGEPPCDMYKLKDWPPSSSFSERLPRHHAEFLLCLPFKHYTHPEVGVLNLATKFPKGALRPDLGPKTYIAYGVREEMKAGNSVTKLHCDMSDAVNVLMHSKCSKAGRSAKSQGAAVAKVSASKKKQPPRRETSGGALWDIFRREDVGRLQEYILKYWTEFFDSNKPEEGISHPVHDQLFYLNEEHKRRLKAELGVEAWTFEQHVGEAVFIPAGCPHQVRNLHSCIKVAMDFVSPENVEQCVKLTEEFRMLPNSHPSKEDKLEVRKMVFQAAKLAVQDLEKKPDEMPMKVPVKGRTPEEILKKASSGSRKTRRKGVPHGAKPS